MRLEGVAVDWAEVEGIIEDAYCAIAPAKLVALNSLRSVVLVRLGEPTAYVVGDVVGIFRRAT